VKSEADPDHCLGRSGKDREHVEASPMTAGYLRRGENHVSTDIRPAIVIGTTSCY
jgi:hypothetical protein